MSRLTNIFSNPQIKVATNYSTRQNSTSLLYGGQNGWAPDLTTWVNAHPYITRNVIPILLEVPRGYLYLPPAERDYWIGALRHMVEDMPLRIDGLQYKLTVSHESINLGGSGGQVMEVPNDVKEEPISLTFVWDERSGMTINRFLGANIRTFIMDPNTKYPTFTTIANMTTNGKLTDLLADVYTFSMMFIEPDETGQQVNQAWIVANMSFKDTGENSVKRDLNSAGEKRELSIPVTGFYQYGAGVDRAAQKMLDTIRLTHADPFKREAFIKEIADSVSLAQFNTGYHQSVQQVAEHNVVDGVGGISTADNGIFNI